MPFAPTPESSTLTNVSSSFGLQSWEQFSLSSDVMLRRKCSPISHTESLSPSIAADTTPKITSITWHNVPSTIQPLPSESSLPPFSVMYSQIQEAPLADLLKGIADDLRDGMYNLLHLNIIRAQIFVTCESAKSVEQFQSATGRRWRDRGFVTVRCDEDVVVHASDECMSTWLC